MAKEKCVNIYKYIAVGFVIGAAFMSLIINIGTHVNVPKSQYNLQMNNYADFWCQEQKYEIMYIGNTNKTITNLIKMSKEQLENRISCQDGFEHLIVNRTYDIIDYCIKRKSVFFETGNYLPEENKFECLTVEHNDCFTDNNGKFECVFSEKKLFDVPK